MSSDLLSDSPLTVATPYTTAATDSFKTDALAAARANAQRQAAIAKEIDRRNELLAQPNKIDNLVSNALSDVYPLATKPKAGTGIAGMDKALSDADHPMAGIGQAVRDQFKQALQDNRTLNASPYEILNAVKQNAMNQKNSDGKTMLEQAYDYKMKKDQGGLFSFHPTRMFGGELDDKNTVALPGYQEYKAKHEQQYTSVPEAFAFGAAGTALAAGLAAVTGGESIPITTTLGKMAMSGAMAVPEFKAFDAATNAVKNSNFGQDPNGNSLGKLGAEMALGIVAGVVAHKGINLGLEKSLSAAVDAGKLSESTVATLRKTGFATDAINAFEAKTAEQKSLAAAAQQLDAAKSAINAHTSKIVEQNSRNLKLQSLSATQEANMPVEDFMNALHQDYSPSVKPSYLDAMGVNPATLDAAKSNPNVLFEHITDPEVVDQVFKNIENGMPSQQAVLKGFNQEAAMKIDQAGRTADVVNESFSRGELPDDSNVVPNRMTQLMTGSDSPKVAKAGYTKKVKGVGIDFENSGVTLDSTPEEINVNHTQELLNSSAIKVSEGSGKSAKGANINLGDSAIPATQTADMLGKRIGSVTKGTGADIKNPLIDFGNTTKDAEIKPASIPSDQIEVPVNGERTVAKGTSLNTSPIVVDFGEPKTAVSYNTELATEAEKVAKGSGEIKPVKINFDNNPVTEVTAAGKNAPSTSVNLTALATAGILAGGMTLFGVPGQGPQSAQAGVIGEGIKEAPTAVEEVGKEIKKLFDGGISMLAGTVHDAVEKITSPEIKDAIVNATMGGPKDSIQAAGIVKSAMKAVNYKDVSAVNKALEEMGISTETRVGYHGTPSAESTTKGHSADFANFGLYNDDGEFAKYFSHDPEVSAGYSGVDPEKSLLVVKKSYPMEGAVPQDVDDALKEAGFAANDAHDAWQKLGAVAHTRAAISFEPELDAIAARNMIDFDPIASEASPSERVASKLHDLEYGVSEKDANRIAAIHNVLGSTGETAKKDANDILRSLGYDSITHLDSGDGYVTIALKQGVEKPFFSGADVAQNVMRGALLLAGSVPVLSLLEPKDAQASELSMAGKVVNEAVTKSLMDEANGDIKQVFKLMFERHLVSEPVTPGTTALPDKMQRQLYQAPTLGRSVSAFNEKVAKTTTKLDGIARFLSAPTFANVYGTTNNGIAIQLASMQNAIANNTANGLDVAKYIIQGVKGIKPEHAKEIADYMKPVQDAYDAVAIPMRAAELQTAAANKIIDNVTQALKDGKYSQEDAQTLIQEQVDKKKKLQALFAEFHPQFASVDAKYEEAKNYLIQKYPSARISYAVEDPSMVEKNPGLFSLDERAAVSQFRNFYNSYKVRAQEVGLDVISGDYINHTRDKTAINAAMQQRLDEAGVTIGRGIPLTDFFQRSKYSKQMIPDIQRNAFEYVPDTEKRIQNADFWRVGRQDGWHAFSQNEFIRSNKVWSDYFDRIKQSMVPPPNTFMNTLADRYSSIETLRLLGGLPSAPFKHLFKNIGTWATLGFTHSMSHLPESVLTTFRNTTNEALRSNGITEGYITKGALDDFVKSMVRQRVLSNPLDNIERPDYIVNSFDKWLANLNDVGGIGIKAIEAMDRSHTVLSALDMAMKKGMTAEQAMYGIYDTILKNNFLGGALNPSWLHNPKIRALALFQSTPFKILERRLVNAYHTGKDVQTAFGVIKNQRVEETLKQMSDIGYFIKGAQNDLKKNMIYDALTSSKDVFGNSVSRQFMKELLLTGAAIGAGNAAGVDFSAHVFHLPFFRSHSDTPTLSTSPIIDAAWKTVAGKPSPGHANSTVSFLPTMDDDKEFFAARFFRHWTSTTGGAQPLVLRKFERISSNDIPKIYKDSPLRYFFSVPSSN